MARHSEQFMAHLQKLQMRDRGAMAALRHSMAFAPGAGPRVFPYIERFAGNQSEAGDPRRLALYIVAGLFAQHPAQASQSFASAFGELSLRRESTSIEKRFIALLEANHDGLAVHLRHALNLLESEEIGFDYVRLLDDLSRWLSPVDSESAIRQHWVRDFYNTALGAADIRTDGASFVSHLVDLAANDRAALAALRQSLAFAPGSYPKSCPLVEPFVDPKWWVGDARRSARYLVAGVFALNPIVSDTTSLAAALSRVARQRESGSIEGRFAALLGADAGNVADHLRQAARLVADDKAGYNPAWLLSDMSTWLNPRVDPARMDRLRQRWARDFYQNAQPSEKSPTQKPQTEGA